VKSRATESIWLDVAAGRLKKGKDQNVRETSFSNFAYRSISLSSSCGSRHAEYMDGEAARKGAFRLIDYKTRFDFLKIRYMLRQKDAAEA